MMSNDPILKDPELKLYCSIVTFTIYNTMLINKIVL